LEDACLKVMSKEPALRHKTGAELAAEVRAAMRPRASLARLLAQSGAALLGVAAVGALVLSLVWGRLPAAPPAALPATFSNFDLRLMRDEQGGLPMLNDEFLPLTNDDQLVVQATFDRPAYGYLFAYEQDGGATLLWPAGEELKNQHLADRIIYPPLSGVSDGLTMPNADGSTLVIALASQKPLEKSEIAELLRTKLSLGVSPEDASASPTRWLVAHPAPKFNDHIVLRGGRSPLASRLRVPDDFKRALSAKVDAYYGIIVSHKKTTDRVEE
jgi:hypothetical protein